MKIPKIIHQTWKNKIIPDKWRVYQQKVQALHPDWEYRLWTDDDNLTFVKEKFPKFFPLFQAIPFNIMRADIIRYLFLYEMGGVYLDLDYEMLKPFDLAEAELVLPKNRSTLSGDIQDSLGNSFLASVPKHPFWEKVILSLTQNPPIGKLFSDVEILTGPIFLTHIYQQYAFENITTPEKIYFHPTTPRSQSQYKTILQNEQSYGIHHCAGSWRSFPVRFYIWKRQVSKIWQKIQQYFV